MPIKKNAFTLIELLIVVAIIAILAGVTLSVINTEGQQNRAQDSIRLANMNKLVLGLLAYETVEGFPAPGASSLGSYIQNWPDGEPEVGDNYTYHTDGVNFGVTIPTESVTGGYKFRSEWGEVRNCSDLDPSTTLCGIDDSGGSPCTSNGQCAGTQCAGGTYPGCSNGACSCFGINSYPCTSDAECAALNACGGLSAFCDTDSNSCYCSGAQP